MADRRILVAGTLLLLAATALPAVSVAGTAHAATLVTNPTALVNPTIGTGSNGDFTAETPFPAWTCRTA